jgi:hypothetical protein
MNWAVRKKYVYLALVLGVITVGLGIMFVSGRASKSSEAFSPAEAKAASELQVSPPPAPTPPAWAIADKMRTSISDVFGKTASDPENTSDACTGSDSADFYCFEALYQRLVKDSGISTAFADLKSRYEKSEFIKSQCHPLTHVIGRSAAEKFSEVSDAYKAGDSYCWSGYYHGVLETFISRIGRANIPAQIDNVCKKLNLDGRYSFDYFNCVHGLGHGLMAITDNELYQSLKYCDSLTGDWEQQSCAGGVYMENVIVDGLNHTTKYLDPKRPQYPCDESPDKYKNTCYMMQTSYMLKINNGDFKQTFAWCRDAGQFTATCHQSLGRDASGRSVSVGTATRNICLLGDTEEEITNCVIGAVKDFVSYFHSNKQALEFCDLFEDSDIRYTCGQTVLSYYQSF